MEVWKPFCIQERIYYVSNTGRVKNKYNKILHAVVGSSGYEEICLCVNYKRYYKRVHRLVAQAFLPNPNNYPCVNHINGNKLDNNVSNLEWCTVAHNTQHSYNHGYQRGKSGNCKLSDAQVILIRRLRLAGLSRFEVCALFPEIKQSTIFDCYYYETYKHIQREDILYDEFSC